MSDVRVIVRIKNARLIRFREDRGKTQAEMAKSCGMTLERYTRLENMHYYPVIRTGQYVGQWDEYALAVERFTGIPCEELFPEVLERFKNVRIERDMDLTAALAYQEQMALTYNPEAQYEKAEMNETINTALGSLVSFEPNGDKSPEKTARMKRIVELHFGLNGNAAHDFTEIGKIMGISGGRVQQIFHKAMRMMRHPARAAALKQYA